MLLLGGARVSQEKVRKGGENVKGNYFLHIIYLVWIGEITNHRCQGTGERPKAFLVVQV